MDFVIGWLCYLAAFAAGSLLAWLIAGRMVTSSHSEATDSEEQHSDEGAA